MKTKILILFLLISSVAAGQSTVPIKGDSVVISKTGGWAELVVRNRTKDSVNGVMVNIGNGVMQFKRIRALNDSQFLVGGDTITIRGSQLLTFTTIPTGATNTALYKTGNVVTARAFGDSTFSSWIINGVGKLVNVMDTAAMRTWILTFASEADTLPTMTFTDGGVGTAFLNLLDDTTAVIKDVKDSIFSYWVSHDLYNVHYLDTAAMRTWISTFTLSSSDTANLLFDTIPGGTSLPTAIFQSGDTLRTRGFGDSAFMKFSINGAGVLVGRNDTAAMRTWILTFASGGGGGGCSTCWDHTTLNTLVATGQFGTASNHGIEIYTNNVKRAEWTAAGKYLYHAATDVANFGGVFNDTINFEDAIKIGGVQPLGSVTAAASNALLGITSASSASAQGMISIWSGASSTNPVFLVTAQGLVSAPVMASAWTAALYRFASTTGQLSVSNLGGTLGYLLTFNSGSVTSSTASTDGGMVLISGTYNTASPNTNTGKWASLNVMPTIDQADAGTAQTASIKIQASLNAAFDYSAIWILDGGKINTNGSIFLNTAGGKINIATGTNASAGTGTLSSGAVTVNTTAVTANSLILVTATSNSSLGNLYISAKSAGTSFTVTSTNGSDASTFNWLILN